MISVTECDWEGNVVCNDTFDLEVHSSQQDMSVMAFDNDMLDNNSLCDPSSSNSNSSILVILERQS